jgi:hypothetical protein
VQQIRQIHPIEHIEFRRRELILWHEYCYAACYQEKPDDDDKRPAKITGPRAAILNLIVSSHHDFLHQLGESICGFEQERKRSPLQIECIFDP